MLPCNQSALSAGKKCKSMKEVRARFAQDEALLRVHVPNFFLQEKVFGE
jgi:hypothetical protein